MYAREGPLVSLDEEETTLILNDKCIAYDMQYVCVCAYAYPCNDKALCIYIYI